VRGKQEIRTFEGQAVPGIEKEHSVARRDLALDPVECREKTGTARIAVYLNVETERSQCLGHGLGIGDGLLKLAMERIRCLPQVGILVNPDYEGDLLLRQHGVARGKNDHCNECDKESAHDALPSQSLRCPGYLTCRNHTETLNSGCAR